MSEAGAVKPLGRYERRPLTPAQIEVRRTRQREYQQRKRQKERAALLAVASREDGLGGGMGFRDGVERDMEWAYEHLPEDLPTQAPSRGARAMHTWARENRDQFMRMVLARVGKGEREGGVVEGGGCEDFLGRVDAFLKEAGDGLDKG